MCWMAPILVALCVCVAPLNVVNGVRKVWRYI